MDQKCGIIFVHSQSVNFFNIAIAILDTFSPPSYSSFNFAIENVVAFSLIASFFIGFVHWFIASLLYCSQYSYHSFTLLKAIVKSFGNLFASVSKSEKEKIRLRAIILQEAIEKSPIFVSHFGSTNIIFVDCTILVSRVRHVSEVTH